jgi:hypothetical protein
VDDGVDGGDEGDIAVRPDLLDARELADGGNVDSLVHGEGDAREEVAVVLRGDGVAESGSLGMGVKGLVLGQAAVGRTLDVATLGKLDDEAAIMSGSGCYSNDERKKESE